MLVSVREYLQLGTLGISGSADAFVSPTHNLVTGAVGPGRLGGVVAPFEISLCSWNYWSLERMKTMEGISENISCWPMSRCPGIHGSALGKGCEEKHEQSPRVCFCATH